MKRRVLFPVLTSAALLMGSVLAAPPALANHDNYCGHDIGYEYGHGFLGTSIRRNVFDYSVSWYGRHYHHYHEQFRPAPYVTWWWVNTGMWLEKPC